MEKYCTHKTIVSRIKTVILSFISSYLFHREYQIFTTVLGGFVMDHPIWKSGRRFSWAGMSVMMVLFLSPSVNAQLTGTKTIPGNYATIELAVADLNGQGVGPGGVTFNVAANHTETPTATISITVTGTLANPIVFQKSGVGANPLITAYTGGTAIHTTTASPHDGLWNLVGSDYVTIDGIDLRENMANSGTALMEYGYALLKASDTDGCQNNTIQNCTITLDRTNSTTGTVVEADNGATGIWVANTLSTGNATVTITDVLGTNSNNQFFSNTIQNCNTGIYLRGFAATSPFTLYDQDNDIGGSSAGMGNTIINYGGGGVAVVAHAIRGIYQNGFNFSNNTINSNDGSGVNHTSTLRGIFMSTATSASGTIDFNTVTLHGGSTTSLIAAIENNAGSTAAGNTISISNNIVQNSTYTTATSGSFMGIDNGGTAASVEVFGNIVSNNTLGVGGTGTSGTFTGITVLAGTGNSVSASGNTVTNNQKNGTSGTMVCLDIGSGVPVIDGNTISDNTFNSTSGATSANLHGIRNSSSGGATIVYSNNQVFNLLFTSANTASANAVNGIISSSASTSEKTIYNNLIYNLQFSNSSTGSGTVTGINHTTASIVSIFNNKIYDLIALNGAASVVVGITHGTTTTTSHIYNNLIGNLLNAQASLADAVKGINITNATASATNNVSYNTIHINAVSSGTNFGTTGIFHTGSATATTGTLILRNNIVVNNSTPNGTGLTVAYRRSSTNLANYGNDSNNNLFFAGTPGSANLIFYDGTNADQTLMDFKTRVAPRDAASVTENPPFLSLTGSDPTFLHIDPNVGTQVESGGSNVAGITNDYDGQIRQGNGGYAGTGTAPDIGADEGEFTGADLSAPSITYTPLTFTCATGNRALDGVIITDATGVPTAGALQPRVYYKKGIGGSWFSSQGSLASGSGMNGMWDFTIVAADMGGVASGDIIYYYVIAQDIAIPANIGSNPGPGLVATDVNTVTTPPTTPNDYAISNTLTGTYMVGAGQTYLTLTDAVNAYNTSCVSGAVVFELVDAFYSGSETFPIVINSNPDASSTNTLTIRPATGTAVTISGTGGASATALIRLNGAKYITIDGVNSGGASLTIENTSVTGGSAVLWLSSNGEGLGASNNTIENCAIKAGVTQNSATTTTYGIVIAGSTLSLTTSSVTAGNDNDNNTIQGNTITKCRYGIYTRGGSTTNPNIGTVITNNIFGPESFGTESLGECGVLAREENGILISGNEIRFVGGDFANTSGGSDRAGIIFGTDVLWSSTSPPTNVFVVNAVITKNIIHDIIEERLFSAVGIGMPVADGANPTNNVVANNMLYNIKSNGTTGDQAVGIGMSASNGDVVVYNTIYMTGDTDPNASAGTPTISGFGLSINTASVTNPVIQDNIIWMDLTSSSASGLQHACINVPSSYAWGTGLSNYNDLYVLAGNTQANVGCVGGSGGTFHTTLAAWQAAVTQDANSLSIEPVFVSATDLHLIPASNVGLDNFGAPVTGITEDIDGDMRDATNPDMGADEFTPVVGLDVGITALVSPVATGCYTAAETVTVTLLNYSLNPIDFAVNNVTVTVTATGGYNSNITLTSGVLASNTSQDVILPMTIDLTANGMYTFNAMTTLAGDITPANDAMAPVDRIVLALGGTLPVGTGQSGYGGFETVTSAIAAYNTSTCFTGNVIFELYDATYTTPAETFPISINVNPDAGSYTLTIRPESGVTSEITGSASSILKFNGVDNVTIDGSNNASTSIDLTISNTSTATNSAVVWVSSMGTGAGATNNTIKNTNVKAGSRTVTSAFGIYVGGTTISATGTGDDNDALTIQNNNISKAYYGIYARATSSGVNNGLVIRNNSIGSENMDDYIGFRGIQIYQADGAIIEGNTIFNIVAGIANLRGMELVTGFVNSTVSKNTIYEISYTASSNSGGKGITINSGSATSNVTFSNNVVYGLKGHASATATNNTWGLMLEGGGGYNIYHNSINISDDRTTPSAPSNDFSGAVYIASTVTALNMRNNVFVTTAAPAGTGKTYAVYCLAANTAFTDINYNDYWAAGTNRFVGFIDATDRVTLADMQAGFGQNANSLVADPLFNSNTNLTPLPGSPLVGSGTMGTGITMDILGVTRDVSAPTIGAYEEAGDVSGPVILYTLIAGTLCTSAFDLTATISDLAGVNSSVGTKPRLYYKKSGDANTYAGNTSGDNGWKYVEASNASSPFTFTMNFSLLQSPVIGGDEIQYFVVAQDNIMPANVSIHRGAFAVTPSSVALTSGAFPISGAINSYMIVAGGLSSNVTIGAAGTYPSLTGVGGLFEAINASGLLANINVTILDATLSETGVTSLNEIRYGCGGPFTLTISPGVGVTTVLSGSSSTPLFNLNGADYVTFDGSNNGTSSKDMTLRNTSVSAGVVRFINDATFNTFMNTIIEGANTSTTNGVVLFSTSVGGSTGNSFNTLSNCFVRDRSDATGVPANAVYSSGTAGALNASNSITGCYLFNFNSSGINLATAGIGGSWQITNNNIFNAQSTPSAATQNGILIAGGSDHTISENFIGGNAPGATGTWSNTGNILWQGISLSGGNATIADNTIANYTGTNTGVSGRVRGVAITSDVSGSVISDNSIHDLLTSGSGTGLPGGSAVAMGIYFFPGGYQTLTITNNTIFNISIENTSALITSNVAAGMVLTNFSGVISRNMIHSIKNKTTGSTAGQPPIAAGLYARFFSNGIFVNNMISLGSGETTDTQFNGVMITGGTGGQHHYYFNSIFVGGMTSGAFGSHAFVRGENSAISVGHPVILTNNILDMERTGGTSLNYAIANQGASPGAGWTSDYNDLYNPVATDIGFWDATGWGFAGWQVASAGDANSVSVAPVFAGVTDLHLTAGNAMLDNVGIPIAGIEEDIDQQTRNILTPDLGADEFNLGCSLIVTNTNDSGGGSLRDVIACVVAGETVLFDGSLSGQTITLTSGEIVINKTLGLAGLGKLNITLSGNNASRIFHVQTGNTFLIRDIALKNASALFNGGALFVEGSLRLRDTLLENNFENGVPKALTIITPAQLEILGNVEMND